MCSLLRSQDYIYYLFVDLSIFPNEITFQHVARAPKADQSPCDNLRRAKTTHRCVLPSTAAQARTLTRFTQNDSYLNFVENFRESFNSSSWKEAYRETAPCLLLFSEELARKNFETGHYSETKRHLEAGGRTPTITTTCILSSHSPQSSTAMSFFSAQGNTQLKLMPKSEPK